MESSLVEIRTGDVPTVVDITHRVVEFCRGKGDGLVNVFAPHATAGLALIETSSGAEEDLLATLEELLPRSHQYVHRHGSPGHGADHVLPALISPSLTIPVLDGQPALGTWQSVVLVDPNRDNSRRQLRLSFVAG
ncbi:MAG TPA: secondary thiamine-phosphate synthase enzyme YjbQ [Acidimicrobiia bacterium]|nr:secondary thiamine-phosphate synthase enzyme YjbQ [Acidimicrobiia bacterium]